MRKTSRAEASAAHSKLMNLVLTTLGSMFRDSGRFWRNETGMALNIRTQEPFKYGLKGSSDIIGIKQIEITPDMVGTKIGVFTAYEIKTGNAVQSVEQKNFQKMVESFGGRYQVIRSVEDLKK